MALKVCRRFNVRVVKHEVIRCIPLSVTVATQSNTSLVQPISYDDLCAPIIATGKKNLTWYVKKTFH